VHAIQRRESAVICNLAILQPLATNFIGGGHGGRQNSDRGRTSWPPLRTVTVLSVQPFQIDCISDTAYL